MYEITARTLIIWFITAIIGLITIYLVRYYTKVYELPFGPFPYPVVGNLLMFRGTKDNQFLTIAKLKEKYGAVFTVWMSHTPIVFVSDLELIKEGFNNPKNTDLMGRVDTVIKRLLTHDVIFSDYGPTWTSLRKVAHRATKQYMGCGLNKENVTFNSEFNVRSIHGMRAINRKLATSEKLLDLVNTSVDLTVGEILTKEGSNKPFDIINYMYLMMYNVIASSVFGKSYSLDDPEFNFLVQSFEYFQHNLLLIAIVERMPFLKLLFYRKFKKWENTISGISRKITEKYSEHLIDNQKGLIRDVCDGLIEAKQEAIAERKESAQHFSDNNLSHIIFDLFLAGTDTTNYTMRWIILLMANYIDMQKRMREEIETTIGDRMATHDDNNKCIFVNAFILETLRNRPVAPVGDFHRAMCDTNIRGYKIPENTLVSPFIWNVHHNHQYWPNPQVFDPQRFIVSDGKSVNTKHSAFIPFGIGRRVCLGEKLALEDLFLLTVRLLQSTSEYLIALPDGERTANLVPDPDVMFFCSPIPYKIILKSKE